MVVQDDGIGWKSAHKADQSQADSDTANENANKNVTPEKPQKASLVKSATGSSACVSGADVCSADLSCTNENRADPINIPDHSPPRPCWHSAFVLSSVSLAPPRSEVDRGFVTPGGSSSGQAPMLHIEAIAVLYVKHSFILASVAMVAGLVQALVVAHTT